MICQLSANLQAAAASRETLHAEYKSQAEQLAQQVQMLQQQLQEVGTYTGKYI